MGRFLLRYCCEKLGCMRGAIMLNCLYAQNVHAQFFGYNYIDVHRQYTAEIRTNKQFQN